MPDAKLDSKRTALVTIDLQNGIVSAALTPHKRPDVVARSIAMGQKLRQAGGLIVAVRVIPAPDDADWPQGLTDASKATTPGGYPADWGDPVPELGVLPPDIQIIKRQWSAFYGTELDLQLRRRGIDTIILSGVSTNFGVESTARDAWAGNYNVILVEDASSSYSEGLHDFAVRNILPRLARIRSSDDILRLL